MSKPPPSRCGFKTNRVGSAKACAAASSPSLPWNEKQRVLHNYKIYQYKTKNSMKEILLFSFSSKAQKARQNLRHFDLVLNKNFMTY